LTGDLIPDLFLDFDAGEAFENIVRNIEKENKINSRKRNYIKTIPKRGGFKGRNDGIAGHREGRSR